MLLHLNRLRLTRAALACMYVIIIIIIMNNNNAFYLKVPLKSAGK